MRITCVWVDTNSKYGRESNSEVKVNDKRIKTDVDINLNDACARIQL
jgi:hypothetical protein